MANNWINTTGFPSTSGNYMTGLSCTQDGGVYATTRAMYGSNPLPWDAVSIIHRYDSRGNILWGKRSYDPGNGMKFGRPSATSTSGVVLPAAGYAGGATADLLVYDASGSLITYAGFADSSMYDYAVESAIQTPSGDIVITGAMVTSSQVVTSFLAKISSGSIVWQRQITSSAQVLYKAKATGLAIGPSGDIYLSIYAMGNGLDAFIMKYNSQGTLQWQRKLFQSPDADVVDYVVCDSSDGVYAVIYDDDYSAKSLTLVKYNSSGTLQWQRRISTVSGDLSGGGVTFGPDGVIHISTTRIDPAGKKYSVVAGYSQSGVVQWRRILYDSSRDMTGGHISTHTTGIYVSGQIGSSSEGLTYVAKLPPGGDLITSTTGTFSYADASAVISDSAGTLTDSIGNLIDSSGAMQIASSLPAEPREHGVLYLRS